MYTFEQPAWRKLGVGGVSGRLGGEEGKRDGLSGHLDWGCGIDLIVTMELEGAVWGDGLKEGLVTRMRRVDLGLASRR